MTVEKTLERDLAKRYQSIRDVVADRSASVVRLH